MSDYIVQVKVKNGPLLRAMRRRGLGTAAQLSRAAGVSQTVIGGFLSLKRPPLNRHGMWSSSIIRIAETLNAMPEDLFPPQHIRDPLERNTGEIETAFSELSGPEAATAVLATPESVAMDGDVKNAIDDALNCLTEREAEVIRLRFGMDGPQQKLDEVGAALGISRERVRQIEAKGLRKMKHPNNAGGLKNAWLDYEWKRPRRSVQGQRKERA